MRTVAIGHIEVRRNGDHTAAAPHIGAVAARLQGNFVVQGLVGGVGVAFHPDHDAQLVAEIRIAGSLRVNLELHVLGVDGVAAIPVRHGLAPAAALVALMGGMLGINGLRQAGDGLRADDLVGQTVNPGDGKGFGGLGFFGFRAAVLPLLGVGAAGLGAVAVPVMGMAACVSAGFRRDGDIAAGRTQIAAGCAVVRHIRGIVIKRQRPNALGRGLGRSPGAACGGVLKVDRQLIVAGVLKDELVLQDLFLALGKLIIPVEQGPAALCLVVGRHSALSLVAYISADGDDGHLRRAGFDGCSQGVVDPQAVEGFVAGVFDGDGIVHGGGTGFLIHDGGAHPLGDLDLGLTLRADGGLGRVACHRGLIGDGEGCGVGDSPLFCYFDFQRQFQLAILAGGHRGNGLIAPGDGAVIGNIASSLSCTDKIRSVGQHVRHGHAGDGLTAGVGHGDGVGQLVVDLRRGLVDGFGDGQGRLGDGGGLRGRSCRY